MSTRAAATVITFAGAAALAFSLATAVGGCASNDPPKVPEPQPLVIGRSLSVPIAVEPSSARKDAPLEESTGSAPRVWLDSLTTPGKVMIPAGKVVVVHFWATWCMPCTRSIPVLQALYAKHRARGLEVIAVSVDDEKDGVADFAKRHGATFPVGWDEGHKIAEGYKVQTMPSTYVIDRRGAIVNTHGGYHDGEDQELDREIDALLY